MHDLYGALVRALAPLGLAYIHVVHTGDEELMRVLRREWPSTFILNRPGAEIEARADDVASGLADVSSFGRMALSNPDLVERIKTGAALNEPDRATFYGGEERGYTDYPVLAAPASA